MNNKNAKSEWTPGDVALLKALLIQGKTTKEISKVMKRTEGAIHVRKNMLGLKTSRPMKPTSIKKSKLPKGEVEVMDTTPTKGALRKEAKDLTSVARSIARKNGKRVTMAMFFVEDF